MELVAVAGGGSWDVFGAIAVYVAVVLILGVLARRSSGRSPEDYYLAGRGLGVLVLFMALFGTNATTFVLVGVPARAHEYGVGVFGLNAPIVALGIPLSFWAIGSPAREMARRLGALTPAELYAKRFGSASVGIGLFAFFTLYTLPYMVQAVKGFGVTAEAATEGTLAAWQAELGLIAVSVVYTSLGGMRGTAWTNVFQGFLFLVFMVAGFFLAADSLGGLAAATEAVRAHDPTLLEVGEGWLFGPGAWASWGLVIALTVIAFPHMLARLMAARDQRVMRTVCRLYPFALVLLWLPAVMLGVWGAAAFPELEARDQLLYAMARDHMPAFFGMFCFLAVLAAVMSTLDAMILTLGSMLSRDVLGSFEGTRALGAGVTAGRVFSLLVGALVFLLSRTWDDSVFGLSRKAFEGYVTLVPLLLLGVRWRRFNAAGAWASLLAGNAALGLAWSYGEHLPGGFVPAFWGLLAAFAGGFLGSLLGPPPAPDLSARAFDESGSVQEA